MIQNISILYLFLHNNLDIKMPLLPVVSPFLCGVFWSQQIQNLSPTKNNLSSSPGFISAECLKSSFNEIHRFYLQSTVNIYRSTFGIFVHVWKWEDNSILYSISWHIHTREFTVHTNLRIWPIRGHLINVYDIITYGLLCIKTALLVQWHSCRFQKRFLNFEGVDWTWKMWNLI